MRKVHRFQINREVVTTNGKVTDDRLVVFPKHKDAIGDGESFGNCFTINTADADMLIDAINEAKKSCVKND